MTIMRQWIPNHRRVQVPAVDADAAGEAEVELDVRLRELIGRVARKS